MQRLVDYFMRLLSSRVGSPNDAVDYDHLRQLLQKKVSAKPKPTNQRMSSQAENLRFEELISRLGRMKYMTRKTETLYLLH